MARRRAIDPRAYAALDPGLSLRAKAAVLGVGRQTVHDYEKRLVREVAEAAGVAVSRAAQQSGLPASPVPPPSIGSDAPKDVQEQFREYLAALDEPGRWRALSLSRLDALRLEAKNADDRSEQRMVIADQARIVADIDKARATQVLIDNRSVNVAIPATSIEGLLAIVRTEAGPGPLFERIVARVKQVLGGGS